MKLPQFTLRDLLLTVTLLSVGLGCFLAASRAEFPILLYAGMAGMAATGAGLCAPFHKIDIGFMIGAMLSVVLVLAMAICFVTGWWFFL